jgi:hypothetical protein
VGNGEVNPLLKRNFKRSTVCDDLAKLSQNSKYKIKQPTTHIPSCVKKHNKPNNPFSFPQMRTKMTKRAHGSATACLPVTDVEDDQNYSIFHCAIAAVLVLPSRSGSSRPQLDSPPVSTLFAAADRMATVFDTHAARSAGSMRQSPRNRFTTNFAHPMTTGSSE